MSAWGWHLRTVTVLGTYVQGTLTESHWLVASMSVTYTQKVVSRLHSFLSLSHNVFPDKLWFCYIFASKRPTSYISPFIHWFRLGQRNKSSVRHAECFSVLLKKMTLTDPWKMPFSLEKHLSLPCCISLSLSPTWTAAGPVSMDFPLTKQFQLKHSEAK